MLSAKTGAGLKSSSHCGSLAAVPIKSMKKAAFLLSIVFLAGCAAPPPVKIASKLLGRTVFQQVKDQTSDPDETKADNQD